MHTKETKAATCFAAVTPNGRITLGILPLIPTWQKAEPLSPWLLFCNISWSEKIWSPVNQSIFHVDSTVFWQSFVKDFNWHNWIVVIKFAVYVVCGYFHKYLNFFKSKQSNHMYLIPHWTYNDRSTFNDRSSRSSDRNVLFQLSTLCLFCVYLTKYFAHKPEGFLRAAKRKKTIFAWHFFFPSHRPTDRFADQTYIFQLALLTQRHYRMDRSARVSHVKLSK